MSITGWFKATLGYGHGMMGFRGSGTTFYLIELGNGSIECRIYCGGVLTTVLAPNGTVVPNVWQHYAWVWDGTTVSIYLNGNVVGSDPASGSFSTSTTVPFNIGFSPVSGYNFYYNGGIDEISLWNKALSQTEIQDMMVTEPVGNETNLQLYYKFNQGAPGGNNISITNLINEVSANSPLYDGQLLNFAMTGNTSNFIGTMDTSSQAISFSDVPTKLTTSPPFALHASATSGLQVNFTILSGPATLSNDSIVTLPVQAQLPLKLINWVMHNTILPLQ